MNKAPIFIHSLFRSGSTYFFNVFRRSPAGYRCFQEALHYMTYYNKETPDKFNIIDESIIKLLRHPNLDKPYFYELLPIWSEWKDKLTFSAVFDGYFGSQDADDGTEFFKAIIEATKDARPVFEECRTAGRIGLIREKLGGFHIYLWRNPWDQWWSYKTANAFDYQDRMIINAPNNFGAITKLHSYLGFEVVRPEIWNGVFTAEESYLTYYLLWCLGLHEGIKHADLLVNIDRLTESKPYRQEILSALAQNGIEDIDFSDCKIPQGTYFEEDVNFFSPLEDKVYEWLEADLSTKAIKQIQELRKQYQPKYLYKETQDEEIKNLARQTIQIRTVSRRLETDSANYLKKYISTKKDLESKKKDFESKKKDFETRIQAAQKREAEIINSLSWKLTRPLRWIGTQLRILKHKFIGQFNKK